MGCLNDVKYLRWLILAFTCFMGFGGYFQLDLPGTIGTGAEGTIESHFIHHNKTYTQGMNLGLYSAYSWPSILTVFSGVLIDTTLGRRKSTILFSVLVFTGGLLFWLGILTTNYPLMVISRMILGFGSESVGVVQQAFVARWFFGSGSTRLGLSIASSLVIAFLRVATNCNFLISPVVGDRAGATTASFVGVVFAGASLLAAVVLVVLDNRAAVSGLRPERAVEVQSQEHHQEEKQGDDDDDVKFENDNPPSTTKKVASGGGGMNCSHIKQLPLALWIVCIITALVYICVFPLMSIAENYFQVQYGFSHEASGRPVSAFQTTASVGLLFSGFLVDYTGRQSIWLMVALVLVTGVHLLFLFTTITPYVPMIILAFGYFFMVSSLWTVPPFLVPESMIGLSFGLMIAFLNLGSAVFPLGIGAVLDAHTPAKAPGATHVLSTLSGYKTIFALFVAAGALGLLACIWLHVVDRRATRQLGSSPAQRQQMKDNLSDVSEPLTNYSESELLTARSKGCEKTRV